MGRRLRGAVLVICVALFVLPRRPRTMAELRARCTSASNASTLTASHDECKVVAPPMQMETYEPEDPQADIIIIIDTSGL